MKKLLLLTLALTSGMVLAENLPRTQELTLQNQITINAAQKNSLEAPLRDSGFEYEINGDSVTITKYTGKSSSITIPHGVTNIDENTFFGCDNLTAVTIPDNMTNIDINAFILCQKLTKILVSTENRHFKSMDGILFSADGKTLVLVPKGKELVQYSIPDSVTTIKEKAFAKYSTLTTVTIPNSVTNIGEGAFCDCENLKSVTIPESVTTIGKKVFGYATRWFSTAKIENFTIHGKAGSEAQRYAEENGFEFQEI